MLQRWPPPRASVVAWALTTFGAIGVVMMLVAVRGSPPGDALGVLLADPEHPYRGAVLGGEAAYLYSPAILQLLVPFRDEQWFVDAWRSLEGTALVAMAGPLTLPVLFAQPTLLELRLANVNLLMAFAIVCGFRWPALWSFVLLTKVTPGVGLLWFVVRREWRSLAIALGATTAICIVSFAWSPTVWFEWLIMLANESRHELGPGWAILIPWPWPIRVAIGAALVVWGAKRNHRWVVIVAAFVSLPVTWASASTMLVGVIPLIAASLTAHSSRGWGSPLCGRPRSSDRRAVGPE